MTLTPILKNWKTSLAGVANLLLAIGAGVYVFSGGEPGPALDVATGTTDAGNALQDGFQFTDVAVLGAAVKLIIDGIQGLFSRDADKSSEASGAK